MAQVAVHANGAENGENKAANGNGAVKPESMCPELEQKIVKQIEYYFSDANLLRDRFMQTETKKDNGWLPLDLMMKFNRLKQLCPDADVVMNCLVKSPSGLLEVDSTGRRLRRSETKPLPSGDGCRGASLLNPRTVYVKGFALDATLDELMDFFSKAGFPTESIYMRRNKQRKFKGSIFATFDTVENAQKFVKEGPAKAPRDGSLPELKKMLKEDYHVSKAQQRVELRASAKKRQVEIADEKKKRNIEEQMQKLKTDIIPKSVLVISGVPKDANEKSLRGFWANLGNVAWIDLSTDRTTATIRFAAPDFAQTAWDAALAKHKAPGDEPQVLINGQPVKFVKILEGEEEQEYWKGVWMHQAEARAAKRKAQQQRGGRGQNRGGKFGRQNNRGGRRGEEDEDDDDHSDDDDEEPKNGSGLKRAGSAQDEDDGANKKQKVADVSSSSCSSDGAHAK